MIRSTGEWKKDESHPARLFLFLSDSVTPSNLPFTTAITKSTQFKNTFFPSAASLESKVREEKRKLTEPSPNPR
jgi:hypothetical protein